MFSLAGLGFASAGQTVDKTTDWFTIAVQPSGDGAPPLFLSRRPGGVTLEPYVSGDASQMWTTVADFYPGLSPVTSDSGIGIDFGALLGCLAHALSGGCPFSVTVGTPAAKLVNREAGTCLVGNSSATTTAKCGTTRQTWYVTADRSGSGLGNLSTGGGCLTSGPAGRNANFHTVGVIRCGRGIEAWRQAFVVQLVDQLSCQTVPSHICFGNGKQP